MLPRLVTADYALRDLRDACRLVAEHYEGARGVWAYDAFEWINERLFDGRLPWPNIAWQLTSHGGCVGMTYARKDLPPSIVIHPSLLGGTEKIDPWGIPPDLLGPARAFDALIHECIHVSVEYVHGGHTGSSSHDNEVWIGEVNRLAPLLGFQGIVAARSKPVREGKTVKRKCAGNIPFDAAAKFPSALRRHLDQLDYYRQQPPVPLTVTQSHT